MIYLISITLVMIFIGAEFAYALSQKKRGIYRFENSISNLSIGICERLINLFMAPLFYLLFAYIYEHYAIAQISAAWYNWILLLLLTDFVWYWYHRLGHEVNLFWAAHIVHHQSEDFNLTVAARITVFQAWLRTLFWCALPFIGFSPEMVTGILVFHGTYSFFTHTQMIGKLGILEYILITPSHHRVHHSSNDIYLDKNYGDVFVFWDKLFGTFRKETETPVYGLTHPLNSHSFLWQHFHYYAEMFVYARTKKTWSEKIRVLFESPAKMDPEVRPTLEKKLLRKGKQPIRPVFRTYVTLQLIIAFALLGYFFVQYPELNKWARAEYFVLIVSTLIICGAVLEQKRWAFILELFRLGQFLLFGYLFYGTPELFRVLAMVFAFLVLLLPARENYYRYVLRRDRLRGGK